MKNKFQLAILILATAGLFYSCDNDEPTPPADSSGGSQPGGEVIGTGTVSNLNVSSWTTSSAVMYHRGERSCELIVESEEGGRLVIGHFEFDELGEFELDDEFADDIDLFPMTTDPTLVFSNSFGSIEGVFSFEDYDREADQMDLSMDFKYVTFLDLGQVDTTYIDLDLQDVPVLPAYPTTDAASLTIDGEPFDFDYCMVHYKWYGGADNVIQVEYNKDLRTAFTIWFDMDLAEETNYEIDLFSFPFTSNYYPEVGETHSNFGTGFINISTLDIGVENVTPSQLSMDFEYDLDGTAIGFSYKTFAGSVESEFVD